MKSFWGLLIRWIIIFLPLFGLAVFLTVGGVSIGMILGLDTISPMTLEKQRLANIATILMFFPPLILGSLGSFLFLKWTKNIQSKFRNIFAFFWTPILIFFIYMIGIEIVNFFTNRQERMIALLIFLIGVFLIISTIKKYKKRQFRK